MEIRIRKPYDRLIEEARMKGSVPSIPIGGALYLLRMQRQQAAMQGMLNVRPIRKNVFSLSLGPTAFRPSRESTNYRWYRSVGKPWGLL